jgi:hypothetical protein
MNTKILILLVAPLCAQELSPLDTIVPVKPMAVELRQTVLSGEREAAIAKVVELAENCQGWFQARTTDRLELRIPRDSLPGFELELAKLGRRAERRYSTEDLARDFEEQTLGLAGRVRLLETWTQAMAKESQRREALDIQLEMASLASEIDRRKGRLKLLRDRMEYARVVLDFRFQGRSVSARAGRTAFPWLNDLDMDRFRGSFR